LIGSLFWRPQCVPIERSLRVRLSRRVTWRCFGLRRSGHHNIVTRLAVMVAHHDRRGQAPARARSLRHQIERPRS
jgi:hypothetical protein